MVFIAPFIGAVALFAGYASALPRPDSAVGQEVAVSAPNGIVLSDTAELASQLGTTAAAATTAAEATTTEASVAATTTAAYGGSSAYVASATVAATSSAYAPTVTYGSGSSGWGDSMSGSGYDSCVQQCVASFGAPAATYTPSATAASADSGNGGMTHTVIVAPTQGVLRYVPFAVNASVGDTVRFVWNANNHTVTKSSQLELCNKTSDSLFTSGTHDKGFTFDQVVNDTTPTFFFCNTPGHCQKGMFGIINPPNAAGANTSVGSMMPSIVSSTPDLSSMYSYTNSKTQGVAGANTWGQNIDVNKMPDWSHQYIAENVMYARTFMAQNPDVIQQDGSINMSTPAPLVFPADLSANNNAAAAPGSSASSAATNPSSTAASTSASVTPSSPVSNGARSTAVSGGVLAIVALAASFLVL
ncbi:unnamed protein product [Somion occarium]|uniref:Phytocyanin domain-containing protein n=1 Tax=Somion occarium TaxID=3059160 RepID=A0ABP1DAH5_9APHY